MGSSIIPAHSVPVNVTCGQWAYSIWPTGRQWDSSIVLFLLTVSLSMLLVGTYGPQIGSGVAVLSLLTVSLSMLLVGIYGPKVGNGIAVLFLLTISLSMLLVVIYGPQVGSGVAAKNIYV